MSVLLVVLLTGLGLFSVGVAQEIPLSETIQIFVIFSLTFSLCGLALKLRKIQIFPIFPLAGTLVALGLIMLHGINPDLSSLQLKWAVLSLVSMTLLVIGLPSYKTLSGYKYIIAMLGLFLILSPIFVGVERGGAKLWLKFGSLTFQPSELGKIFLAIFFASYLSERFKILSVGSKKFAGINLPDLKYLGPLAMMWALSLLMLIFEKDLGSSLLFFGLFVSILYVATNRPIYPVAGLGLFSVGAVITYSMFAHMRLRVDVWLDPWLNPKGSGYQILQSLFAISSGSFWGRGLGYGFPKLIPAVSTDFIFSLIGEETGLLGLTAVILIYILLISYSMKIAMDTENTFGKLLSFGLASALALQTFVIIAGVTKLIPMTGVTLPFISYGGSSLFSNMLLIGLLLKIRSENP